MKLKPELGLFSLTLYGIGVILGAGVYALIGVGAGLAGNMLWLAFLISAVIAMFTGLSYAELSSMFPKEAAEYNYTRKAFSSELFSFTVGWLLAAGTIIAAAAVALGFGGYFFSVFVPIYPLKWIGARFQDRFAKQMQICLTPSVMQWVKEVDPVGGQICGEITQSITLNELVYERDFEPFFILRWVYIVDLLNSVFRNGEGADGNARSEQPPVRREILSRHDDG